MLVYLAPNSQPPAQPTAWTYCGIRQLFLLLHDGVQFFLKGVLTLSLAIWATMPMMALYTTGDIPLIYNCVLTITRPENWYIYPYQQGMVTTFSYENNHVSTMAYMLIASYPVTNSDATPSMFRKHLPKVLIRRIAMDNRGMWLHSTSFHGESYSQNHPKSINCKVCLILILNVYGFFVWLCPRIRKLATHNNGLRSYLKEMVYPQCSDTL